MCRYVSKIDERTHKSSDLDDHLDGGQRGGDVLRVRRSHRDRHAAGVKAAVKRHDEVNTWWRKEEEEEEGGSEGGGGETGR